MTAAMTTTQVHNSSGGGVVSSDGRELPLREVILAATARAGLAQVVVVTVLNAPPTTVVGRVVDQAGVGVAQVQVIAWGR